MKIGNRSPFVIILILGALTTLGPFSIDMYLPAFEKIAVYFGTTIPKVSLSLSSYFVGLAVGQIFYGPFLDRFGRKKPLYIGLTLYILSSFACMMATSVNGLILARLFQALGGCSATVGSVAMVRDFFSPDEGAKVFSKLMLILSVSPFFAPTVGGWIVTAWGWQTVFLALGSIAIIFLLVVVFFLPESSGSDKSVSLNIGSISKTFVSIFRNRRFFTFAVSGAFSFAGLFTYIAGAPSIFFGVFHLSEKMFGLVFAFLALGMVGGAQFNIFLMKYAPPEKIYKKALQIQTLMGLIFLVGSLTTGYGLYSHLIILFVYIACVGLTYPNATALALTPFEKNSGSASALLGTLQMGIGAVAAATFSILKFQPSLSVSIIFLLMAFLGLLVFQTSSEPLSEPSL
jgi:DHA1 family bicyclomycin/chloramphenicol resistance-like MFS transporter